MELDDIDCKILEILQNNCRESITNIAKEIDLSIDSTKKRIDKLLKKEIFYPKIQLRPRSFGYPNIIEINIKLKEYNNFKYEEFLGYLINHPRISQIIQLSGNCDLKIVIIAKDYVDQGLVTKEIRTRFGEIILDWSECLTTDVLKFENYDLNKLM
jgi:Lrp/AsnC family transcriptional regulator, leucine-responsive regulatory protein